MVLLYRAVNQLDRRGCPKAIQPRLQKCRESRCQAAPPSLPVTQFASSTTTHFGMPSGTRKASIRSGAFILERAGVETRPREQWVERAARGRTSPDPASQDGSQWLKQPTLLCLHALRYSTTISEQKWLSTMPASPRQWAGSTAKPDGKNLRKDFSSPLTHCVLCDRDTSTRTTRH